MDVLKLAFSLLTNWTDDKGGFWSQDFSKKIKPVFNLMFHSVKSPIEKANIYINQCFWFLACGPQLSLWAR